MFKDFKEQKTREYATFRILSSENFLDAYRKRFSEMKQYSSGIVFPEQLIGFKGGIYIVRIDSTIAEKFVMTSRMDIDGISFNRKPVLSDQEVIEIENNKSPVILGQLGYTPFSLVSDKIWFFLSSKQASRFAQSLVDKQIKSL